MLIVVLIVFYLILGCFLDGFSMIVMTLPIVMPIVKAAGFDAIWFGIFLVLVVEMAADHARRSASTCSSSRASPRTGWAISPG